MFTCQEQSSSLPFTCNFHYSYYSPVVPFFFTASRTPLHSTNDGLRKSRRVTGRCFNLFKSNANMLVFHALAPQKCDGNSFAYAAVAFCSPFLDEGKEQRLVAASCVFPRNAMLSSPPSFLICVLLQVSHHSCHEHMRSLVRAAIGYSD